MIVDTGPLVAALYAKDAHHDLAVSHLRRARGRALIPDPVVTEVDIVTRRWFGADVARAFLAAVDAGVHDRVVLDDTLWGRAIEIDEQHADLGLGLVDASVMALAEKTKLPVFTFDFRGFRAVRGPGRGGAWRLVVSESDLR